LNDLTYQLNVVENESTKNIQSLNAEVVFNRSPIDEKESKCFFNIWIDFPCEDVKWAGKPELDPFDENTARALRDFLIFCFPLK